MATQYLPITLLFISFFFGGLVDSASFNITSPPVTDWGVWGIFERFPAGTLVQGIQLRTQKYQGIFADDTAVNAIRLACGDPFSTNTTQITSSQGDKGDWGSIYSCYPGFVNGFQLRVEPFLGTNDDTATNNMRMYCSNGPDPNYYVEADGLNFGVWGEVRRCFTDQAFCGLQTQVEDCSGLSDCTSLNNILIECCDRTG